MDDGDGDGDAVGGLTKALDRLKFGNGWLLIKPTS